MSDDSSGLLQLSSSSSASAQHQRQRTKRNRNDGNGDENAAGSAEDGKDKTSDRRPHKKTKGEKSKQDDKKKKKKKNNNNTRPTENPPNQLRRQLSWIPSWKREDMPAFLDATATVSVATFASRRLPELKQLYHASFPTETSTTTTTATTMMKRVVTTTTTSGPERSLQSGGGKCSNRHLRRRTTAVRSKRHRHRYPLSNVGRNGNNTTALPDAVGTTTTTSLTSNTTLPVSETKMTTTTSAVGIEFLGKTRKSKRKKVDLLSQSHWRWLHDGDVLLSSSLVPSNADMTDERDNQHRGSGDVVVSKSGKHGQQKNSILPLPTTPAPTGTNWLTTHLWHAKRFHMGTFWRWNIPLVHSNRGPRAALRLSSSSSSSLPSSYCMFRDISFERQPLLLSVTFSGTRNSSGSISDSSHTQMANSLLHSLGRVCPDLISESDKGGGGTGGDYGRATSITSFLSGVAMKEGMLYEIDKFPRNAIGPVLWRIIHPAPSKNMSRHNEKEEINVSTPTDVVMKWTVEVRCHPSLRTQVMDCFTALMTDLRSTSSTPTSLTMEWDNNGTTADDHHRRNRRSPRICFRLYGSSSTRVLNEIVMSTAASSHVATEPELSPKSFLEWNRIISDHLAVSEGEMNDERDTAVLFHGAIVRIGNASIKTTKGHECSVTGPSFMELMLVYQSPRPLDCAANRAMSGWEIYCSDITLAKKLWIVLSTTRVPIYDGSSNDEVGTSTSSPSDFCCCCAIGLVEDCHLRLECEPPLLVFPRDYVDTKESDTYWQTNHDDDVEVGTGKNDKGVYINVQHKARDKWQRIRQLYDGGWGRLPIWKSIDNKKVGRKPLPSVNFFELLPSIHKSDEDSLSVPSRQVVTVRGAFGYPFLNAIGGCARFDDVVGGDKASEDDDTDGTKPSRRRKRRISRPQNQTICAPPLSKTERESFAASCTQLLGSLTLPAVLLAHVRSLGKGSIAAGMEIVSCITDSHRRDEHPPLMLGRITTGGFSPSRGVCHGLGVVGASVLLQYLATMAMANGNNGRLVRLVNGDLSLQLLVSVRTFRGQMKANEACLSLVFD